jgi:glycosyltransferase involved in cell wall biosynthesis
MTAVSVIIPSRNRPHLALRAVRSALGQTIRDIEVIVVVDGEDPNSESSLQMAEDPRLHVLHLENPVGGAGARNRGIEAGCGKWIALLDDDDEWMPDKLERQLDRAEHSIHPHPVLSCRLLGRSPRTDYVWPRVDPYLPVAEYLMRRRSLFQGEGLLQTSTLFASRELFLACPFTSGLRKHQDWDWLIRVFQMQGVGLEFLPEPLTVWHVEEERSSIGAMNDWRYSLEWADRMRPSLTAEAYASFLLTFLSASASSQRDWKGFLTLLKSAMAKGKPRPIHLALFFGMWMMPVELRRSVRSKLKRLASLGRTETCRSGA